MSSYLHVWWWNLFPFKKHLLGDSIHSQMHFAAFSGWCLGQVFLHTHWHLSSSNSLLGPQEVGRSLFLHMHWHDDLSNSLWGPQLEGRIPPLQTHWQVSSSNSLFGPQIWNPSDVSRNTAEKLHNYQNFVSTHPIFLKEETVSNSYILRCFKNKHMSKDRQQPVIVSITIRLFAFHIFNFSFR